MSLPSYLHPVLLAWLSTESKQYKWNVSHQKLFVERLPQYGFQKGKKFKEMGVP